MWYVPQKFYVTLKATNMAHVWPGARFLVFWQTNATIMPPCTCVAPILFQYGSYLEALLKQGSPYLHGKSMIAVTVRCIDIVSRVLIKMIRVLLRCRTYSLDYAEVTSIFVRTSFRRFSVSLSPLRNMRVYPPAHFMYVPRSEIENCSPTYVVCQTTD